MKKAIKLILLWILLFIPIVAIITILSYGLSRGFESHLDSNIGKKFELNNIVDTLENKVSLKFETDVTVIDFLFAGCGLCVDEINHFKYL